VTLDAFDNERDRASGLGLATLEHPVALERAEDDRLARLPADPRAERRGCELGSVLVEQQMRDARGHDARAYIGERA
jgi:hypothetical protein